MARNILRALGAALVVAVAFASSAARAGELEQLAFPLAGSIAEKLKEMNENTVSIAFHGPANFPTGSSSGLVQIMTEALKQLGIEVRARSKFALEGKFALTREGAVRVTVDLNDQFGEVLHQFRIPTMTEAQFASLLGSPIDLTQPPVGAEVEGGGPNGGTLVASVQDPQPGLRDGIARPSAQSPFGLQLVVGGTPRAATLRDKLPFVGLREGEEYQVVVTNNSDSEIAVSVEVDGLSVFHFSKVRLPNGGPKYQYWIVPARGKVTVPGWHVDERRAKAFTIVPLEESAAAKLGLKEKIGQITVTMHTSWPSNQQPPAGEEEGGTHQKYIPTTEPNANGVPVTDFGIYDDSEDVGTGEGREFAAPSQAVSRKIGKLQASVTLRYNRP